MKTLRKVGALRIHSLMVALTEHPFVVHWNIGLMVFLNVFTATGAGNQFAELNAVENLMIYQTVCLTNGESFDYSFLHRGRSSATIPDVAQFRIGIPTGFPSGSKPADSYDFNIIEVSTTNDGTVTSAPAGNGTINAPTAAGNAWCTIFGKLHLYRNHATCQYWLCGC